MRIKDKLDLNGNTYFLTDDEIFSDQQSAIISAQKNSKNGF